VGAPTGAACLPYQELSPTFQGFSTKQLVLDTNDPACASDSGLSSVDATVAAAIVAGSRAPGPMTVCLLAQLPAAPCASSSQPGWCYLAGANAPDGCATSIGESPSTMALPSGAFAALACP
jgi:hypothetical protein